MNSDGIALATVFEGWSGYQDSLVHAIEPLSREQLAWRPAEGLRSVGEVARHISLGRIGWFMRMDAPGSADLVSRIQDWEQDRDGSRHIVEESVAIADNPSELVNWLESSWTMVDAALKQWTVADLANTYLHNYNGVAYAVSRQWTIWRIMAHDIHHGGQLSLMLGQQGIEAFELIGLGGHLTVPNLADPPVGDP